jgi:hypothetical protein
MRKTSLTLIALCAALLWVAAADAQTEPTPMCPPPAGPLVGPRFQDNGNGTVTDHQTGLMWEQKTGVVGVKPATPNIHDVNNTYTWSGVLSTDPDGTVFANFLGILDFNESSDGTTITGCFANYCDWRLPTILEVQGIIDKSVPGCGPGGTCIDPTFGPTQRRAYWSGTTDERNNGFAWEVHFEFNPVLNLPGLAQGFKTSTFSVRAVRCGL